jgi:hypothetical protein
LFAAGAERIGLGRASLDQKATLTFAIGVCSQRGQRAERL